MTNSYYNPSGTPGTGSAGSSQPVRLEFASIAAGFALLPAISGNASRAVIINSSANALTVTTGTLGLAGNFATTGAYNTTLIQGATVNLTLPLVDGTLATLAGTETFSNKTFIAPALGTPASGVLTNCTGTAAGLTAGSTLTNANLTGPITSVGNATAVASQTGTGSTFVMNTSPTLVTPIIGVASGTSLSVSGQLTSTVSTGTAPLVVSSTTVVANLNASQLLGNTWAIPSTIGSTTPNTGAFTTLSASGHVTFEGVTSTGATGTGKLVFDNAPTLTGHPTIEGVTSTGATGTGNLVFSASPTFTGTLTAATSSFSGHMTIEGVTSSGATGTGNFVFATGPTVTTLTVSSGGAAITGNTSVATGSFTASGGAFTASPASANVVLSPTGTGVVTINPATAGSMNNVVIGGSTPAAITGTTITDSLGNVRTIVHSGSDKVTTYSLVATDNGQYVSVGASGAITIPNSTFADGNVVTIFNNNASGITITCNTTTCYSSGVNTNKGGGGTLTLSTRGTCTILFLSATSCVVSGNVT